MTDYAGGSEAAIAAASSAGAMQYMGREAPRPSPRELTPEQAAQRQKTLDRLAQLDPVGKKIEFEEGLSRATIRFFRGMIPFEVPGEHDLRGVSAEVMEAEVGTVLGKEIRDPAELVLQVYAQGRFFPPKLPHNYLVRDSEATYSLH